MTSILLTNIKSIYGIRNYSVKLVKGKKMKYLPNISDAYLYCENEKIIDYGNMINLPEGNFQSKTIIDCKDRYVLPSWCDSHTHLIYSKSREKEFILKIKGLSYDEIARKGGGILNSATTLRTTDEQELFEQSEFRLTEVIKKGTGLIEIKSGYGLSLKSEIKMLRVARKLREKYPIDIKTTFLGAHAIPKEFLTSRKKYIDLILNEMIPKVAEEKLANYIDVFCERGFFTVEETNLILERGIEFGLKPKIHANQLSISGGVQVGVKNNAISVDHLECIGNEEIECLKNSNTIATILPSCSFYLNIPYSPARKLIKENIPIALATDYNPGSSPSGNVPFLLSLACIKLKLLPEEAINAITINGAAALESSHDYGSISRGKFASFIITKKIPSLEYMMYAFGEDHIFKVFIKGKEV